MPESHELLSDILNKLIEAQVQNAQVTVGLKNAIEDNNRHLKEVHDLLNKVNAHFSNGFRQEFKDFILESTRNVKDEVRLKSTENHEEAQKIMKAVTDFTNALTSPKSWIGAFLLVASIFGTIAGIVTVVLKLMGGP